TVKENIATRGVPLPAGTAASDLVPAEEDGPAAARIREAGGVILGKTTMPDIGMLSSGLSSFHQLTRNPWNPARNPGGSTPAAAARPRTRGAPAAARGGAGAGAAPRRAAGYGRLHGARDAGGPLRLRAWWTATVSPRPSCGRVPVDPPYYGRVVGPITRTAA